ncbi:unnamed protein product [Hymenolepis diminuta]|uniref:C2H2-type domain-containing protein n=1 Tax=Hymenolepis diminuta TaxID=6216 RepID=A0A564YJV3_HYMDI|nr:unnamed protein product [Hymenolepis diminuta]
MDPLFNNSGFNTDNLLSQWPFDFPRCGSDPINVRSDLTGNQGGSSSISQKNNISPTSATSTAPSMPAPVPGRPNDEAVASGDSLKEELRQALRNIIPHKFSLRIQALIAYTVDDNQKGVISIDETFNQTRPDTSLTPTTSNVLDSSQRSAEISLNPSISGSELGNSVPAPTMPFVNLPSYQSAPPGFPPLTAIFPHLIQEDRIPSLQSLLNANTSYVNSLQLAINSLHLSLPINPSPPPTLTTTTVDMKTSTEVAPNVTITNPDIALSYLRLGVTSRPTASLPNTYNNGSRGTSLPSNLDSRSSPTTSSRPLSRAPSQALFGRRRAHSRRFSCNQCGEESPSLSELNQHTWVNHSSFRCTYCNAKFTQRCNLLRHSLKHVEFKAYTCNICASGYYRKDHLTRHIKEAHPNVSPRLNITTHIRPSECLDYLNNTRPMRNPNLRIGTCNNNIRSSLNVLNQGSTTLPQNLL